MLEWIRENKRWAQLILIALIFPFACTGIEGYRRMQGDVDTVAKVGGQRIMRQEFDAAMSEQIERLKQMFGGSVDSKLVDTPQVRQSVLDQLVMKHVLRVQAQQEVLMVSDDQLRTIIATEPGFQEGGKFSPELYRRYVSSQRMSELQFEAQVRDDIRVQQLARFPSMSTLVSAAVTTQIGDVFAQERSVGVMSFAPAAYLPKVVVSNDVMKSYYDSNQASFETPEQADIEYIVLSADAIGARIKVSPADVEQYYKQNIARYSTQEQRRASHILISVPSDASADVRQQARAKAESILAQVRKAPSEFAKLAKQYSDDLGSKDRGGDLDFFGKGSMVKQFDEVVFAMKQGDISDIVTTDSGFHIIELTAIRASQPKPIDAVRTDIETEIRKQLAARKVAESIDAFNNSVYEQSDSLKPAADQLGLEIKTAKALTRSGTASDPVLGNQKFVDAIFGAESVQDKRNTKAIEIAPNTLVSGRVVAYRARALRPIEEVKPLVLEAVRAQEALRLAKEAGVAQLAAWREGKGVGSFSASVKVTRNAPGALSGEAIRAVFKANTAKLPAYVGVDLGAQGYALYRIDAVTQNGAAYSDDQKRSLAESIERALADAETNAAIESMRARTKVEVLQANALAGGQ